MAFLAEHLSVALNQVALPDLWQQQAVAAMSALDCYNWGYDPVHFTAPEGSYATDAGDGAVRILEFRRMVQALHLSNGDTVNEKLAMKEGRVSVWMAEKRPVAEMIDEAHLLCLSRMPKPEEKRAYLALFESAGEAEKRAVVEDLFWALMTSREFLFQH